MEIAITKMSSKGQVVIPSNMRTNINEGDKILIIQNDGQLILKKASQLDSDLKEDLEFAKKTDDALKRIKEEEKGVKMDFNDFLEEIKKW